MNLGRQMEDISEIYSKMKPAAPKNDNFYVPKNEGAVYSSSGDKNSKQLNELYAGIHKKTSQQVVTESSDTREKLIVGAINTVVKTHEPGDHAKDLLASVNHYVHEKTGQELNDHERDMVFNSLKRHTKQEDEITATNPNGSPIDVENQKSGQIQEKFKQQKGSEFGKIGQKYGKKAEAEGKKTGWKKNWPGKKKNKLEATKSVKEAFKPAKGSEFGTIGQSYVKKAEAESRKVGWVPNGSGKNTAVKKSSGSIKYQDLPNMTDKPIKTPFIKNSGPKSDGVKVPLEPLEPSDSDKEDHYNVNKFSQGTKKISEQNINTDMNKDKSSFDKLFEDVMADDAVELGAVDDVSPDPSLDVVDDEGGEQGEEVTISLPREVAEHLHALLAGVLADAGDDLEGEAGAEADLAGADDAEADEMAFGEKIEAEDLGTPLVNQKKGDPVSTKAGGNKVDSEVTKLAKKGSVGDGKVNVKNGTEEDEGTPLVNQKKGQSTSVKGKANVAAGTVSSKVGGQFFQAN